ncbi:hypothetical protein ACF0H5_011773 [Mactra antiquata]
MKYANFGGILNAQHIPTTYSKSFPVNGSLECDSFHFSDCSFDDRIRTDHFDHTFNLSKDSYSIYGVIEPLTRVRIKHPNKFICSIIISTALDNYKLPSIKALLQKNTIDLLFIAGTKLGSFVDAQFQLDIYHLWAADRRAHCGGVLAYLHSDSAVDRQKQMEFDIVESVGIEIILNGSK